MSSARLRVSAVRYWGVRGGGPDHGGGPLLSLQHSRLPNDFNRVNHPFRRSEMTENALGVNPSRNAVRPGHETATVIQACQFVSERKIAQFCLQHVLFRGATDRTHQEVHCRLIPSATEQSAVGPQCGHLATNSRVLDLLAKGDPGKGHHMIILAAW